MKADAQPSEERDERKRDGGGEGGVAPPPFQEPRPGSRGACRDGLAPQYAKEIIREGERGLVTAVAVLLERNGDDGREIAARVRAERTAWYRASRVGASWGGRPVISSNSVAPSE
jgi:hypothetical protein